MTRSERYIAFLLSALPRLAARRIYPARWPFPMRRHAVLDRALRQLRGRPGVALEFGVYQGRSLRRSARRQPGRQFYGFDSFAGFPDDGRPDWALDFATIALPVVPANCRLMPGWFSETIPEFLRETGELIAFVNIDCDLYSSTREVLFGLGDRLRPGAVLYFDELVNYDTFLWNEMLALFDFLEATGFGIEWIGTHSRVRGVEEMFATYDAEYHPPWHEDVAAGYHRPAAAILTVRDDDAGVAEDPRVAGLAARFDYWTERFLALRPLSA